MHFINLHNKSDRHQEFQCHGYNGGHNITVAPRSKAVIPAADKTSGAIIAVYDGVIGEQAEIHKGGLGEPDTVDISNIYGAGGNMTVQQVGDGPHNFKGDALFMQECNTAWHKASHEVKNAIKNLVFLDHKGDVKRIGPPKDNAALEKFVRTFAEGKTYINIGTWNGHKGDPGDDAQSSAGHGDRDILVTYNDGNAAPDAPGHLAHRTEAPLVEHIEVPSGDTQTSFTTATTTPSHGPGIILTNRTGKEATFFFYDNYWNGNGTAGANFDRPLKSVKLGHDATTHVPLGLSFKGRVQRGPQLPATWAEFQIQASNDGAAHGDISLEQGCDGAATIASTDGHRASNGFTQDIVKDAPDAAVRHKPNGERALASTMGNWLGPGNRVAAEYEYKVLGHGKAYITGGTGVPDVASHNNVLAVTFY